MERSLILHHRPSFLFEWPEIVCRRISIQFSWPPEIEESSFFYAICSVRGLMTLCVISIILFSFLFVKIAGKSFKLPRYRECTRLDSVSHWNWQPSPGGGVVFSRAYFRVYYLFIYWRPLREKKSSFWIYESPRDVLIWHRIIISFGLFHRNGERETPQCWFSWFGQQLREGPNESERGCS